MIGRAENDFDDTAIHPPSLHLVTQLAGRFVRFKRFPVRARFAHRLVGIGDSQNASADRYVGPRQASG
jgi:hypothetical protein